MTPLDEVLASTAATVIARRSAIWRDPETAEDTTYGSRIRPEYDPSDFVAEAMAELGATVRHGEHMDTYAVGDWDDVLDSECAPPEYDLDDERRTA